MLLIYMRGAVVWETADMVASGILPPPTRYCVSLTMLLISTYIHSTTSIIRVSVIRISGLSAHIKDSIFDNLHFLFEECKYLKY